MWLLLAMAILLAGAVAVLLLSRSDRNLSWLGAGSVVIAAVLGCIPAVQVLLGGPAEQFHFPWPVPFGEFFIELDPLSAWFLLPTLVAFGAWRRFMASAICGHGRENGRSARSGSFMVCWCWAWCSSCWRATPCCSWWRGN